jgi:hypothetical protein
MNEYPKPLIGFAFFCGAVVCIWMILFNIRPIQDPDIWWHLASGRYMVEHGVVPKTDVLSLTSRGTEWVNTYWLQEIYAYWLVKASGLCGITLMNALAIASIVFLIGKSNPIRSVPWTTRLLGMVWIFLACQPRGYGWEEKASLVTFGLLALLFHSARSREGPFQRPWNIVWPLLFMLWANMHRGFILGLIILSAFGLEQWLKGSPRRGQILATLLVCVGATLINPWGIHIFGMGWQDYRLSPLNVTGWAQTPFYHLELYWLTLGGFLWVIIRQFTQNHKLGLGFIVTSSLLVGLSVRYASFYRYFVLWSVPWLLIEFKEGNQLFKGATAVILSAVLMVLYSMNLKPRFGINERIFPVRAIDFLKTVDLRIPFFHEYDFGGYYLWSLNGKPPALIDGRYPAVAGYRKLLPEIQQAMQGTPNDFHVFLMQKGLHAAVVKYPSTASLPEPFSIYFPREHWALVYWDDLVLVFVERIKEFEPLIKRYEFPLFQPDAQPQYWKTLVWDHASPMEKRQIRKELEHNALLHPESRKVRLWLDIISSI